MRSTKGNYATGAVLGTRWLTEDLCGGTLIRVLTDRVAVTNPSPISTSRSRRGILTWPGHRTGAAAEPASPIPIAELHRRGTATQPLAQVTSDGCSPVGDVPSVRTALGLTGAGVADQT